MYFDLQLFKDNRVLLVRYEDLVTDPLLHFKKIFNFIGSLFKEEYIKDIHASSIAKSASCNINENIERICKELMERLDKQYILEPISDDKQI